MRKIRHLKRPVYRKTINGEFYLKIYPDEKVLIIKSSNLFSDTEIVKSKDNNVFKEKDDKKRYLTARKHEFIIAYRQARKAIKL